MTKQDMILAILEDMYRFNSKQDVDKRWKSFLNRQTRFDLYNIYTNRGLKEI